MKNVSTELSAHLAGDVTTLATCWKITRRDGTILGFTDHDETLQIGEVDYLASSGFTPSAVSSSSQLNVDDLDVEGMLSDDAIAEKDLLAGLYDYAEISVFQTNYHAPEQGDLTLRTGWLGEVQTMGGRFVAEVRGLTQQLSQTIGERYSPACRATLGDGKCGVDLAAFTYNGSITSLSDARSVFSDSACSEEEGYFTSGKITFNSGANTGLSMEVKQFSNGEFACALPLPATLEIGDNFTAIAGCDKRIETCIAVFNNAINFRGEPHVPGLDRMLETSATRNDWT